MFDITVIFDVRGQVRQPVFLRGGLNNYVAISGRSRLIARTLFLVMQRCSDWLEIAPAQKMPCRLLADNTVFPHAGAKSAGIEVKEYRSAVFPLDAPPCLLQHLKDMVVFQNGEGFDLSVGRFLF